MRKATRKMTSVIMAAVVIAGIALGAGFLIRFIRGVELPSLEPDFYVLYGDRKIKGDAYGERLPFAETIKFGCKYKVGILDKFNFFESNKKTPTTGYDVKVTAAESNSFIYLANGQGMEFNSELDLTDYFNVKKEDDYFTLKIPKKGIEEILWRLTGNYAAAPFDPRVKIKNEELEDKDYFVITVKSGDGKMVINISFGMLYIPVTDISFSETRIII